MKQIIFISAVFLCMLSCNKANNKSNQTIPDNDIVFLPTPDNVKSRSVISCDDLCFMPSRVCFTPSAESWICWSHGGGWWMQHLSAQYICNGQYQTIPLIVLTNSTPVSTVCVNASLPINTPIRIVNNGGCGNHDFLCDINVSITTNYASSAWYRCTTNSTFIGLNGIGGSTPWFTLCSKVACAQQIDPVKL
jgi:hypothetical protein